MLEVIYVVRHASRLTWSVNPRTGEYFSNFEAQSPTGHAADPVLSAHGVDQSTELARHMQTIEPPVDVIYSSPWYRCLQTIRPLTTHLFAAGKAGGKVHVEPGLGEFFGSAPFDQPRAATVDQLKTFFDNLAQDGEPICMPNPKGETIAELHDRIAFTLNEIIARLDKDPSQPKALLICTHAAAMIAIGRVLTGQMPEDPDTPDFNCFTASLSRYTRRTFEILDSGAVTKPEQTSPTGSNESPPVTNLSPISSFDGPRKVNWRNYGVRGFWVCEQNGATDYLRAGAERGWRFADSNQYHVERPAASRFSRGLQASTTGPGGLGGAQTAQTGQTNNTGMDYRPVRHYSLFERFCLQFNQNPYGLPGLFYMVPMLLLVAAVVINIVTMVATIERMFGVHTVKLLPVWGEVSRLATNLVQLIFFFYPPLWGVRVVEAMMDAMVEE